MQLISIENIKENMCVAKNIYTAEGYMLLAKGVSLNEKYIKRLKQLGIGSLYILDNKFDEITIEDIVSESVKLDAIKNTKDIMDNVRQNKNISGEKISIVIHDVMDELFLNKDVLFHLTDIRSMNDYTYAHNVSVAVYSLVTGIAMGYDYKRLKVLGLGAILHDVGKAKIKDMILNKPDKLNPLEYAEVKKHCQIGFDILRNCNEISCVSAHIAWQHHERIDGTGYPRKLKGTEINEYARIVAIADVYDALSTDRVYRKKFIPHEIINYLKSNADVIFDSEITQLFIDYIAPYPVGCMILLNTGEKAIVVNISKQFPELPRVKIITDRAGNAIDNCYEKDLRVDTSLFIIEQIKES